MEISFNKRNCSQWRFFYNKGSLDGNELIRQFIDVVCSYELMGVKIYGMVSDGGGGNTKFFNIISEYQPLNGKWIDGKCLRTLNPIDPTRYIYTSGLVLLTV